MVKLTDVEHKPDGTVCVYFGKHGMEFPDVQAVADWVADKLGGEEVQRAILLRRALSATTGTLKPVRQCRGFRVDVNLEVNNPVTIVKDASSWARHRN